MRQINTLWTQFLTHVNYKIIYSNVIYWANVTKIHTTSSAKHYFWTPDEHALYKDNFATGNGELSKVIADIEEVDHTVVNQPTLRWKRRQDRLKTAAPLLFANKSSAVKHASWSNSCRLWYSVLRAVCRESLLFLFFAINYQWGSYRDSLLNFYFRFSS